MSENGELVTVPDFIVREVGALHLQLAAAQEEIQRLSRELAMLRAEQEVAEQEPARS